MHIYMTFAILPFVAHIVSCEIIKESAKDMKQAKTTLKPTTGQTPVKSTSEVPSILLKQGYITDKTPSSRITNQPEVRGEQMLLNSPHSLTKLAKTLSLGFDPSFSKGESKLQTRVSNKVLICSLDDARRVVSSAYLRLRLLTDPFTKQSTKHPVYQMYSPARCILGSVLRLPYCSTDFELMDYFEPFERRPRPVTLVAFRKNGYASRHTVKYSESSNEVAEQQSPFNEVGSFWQNEA